MFCILFTICRIGIRSKFTGLTTEHILLLLIMPFKMAAPTTHPPSSNVREPRFPAYRPSSLIIKLSGFFQSWSLVFISLLGLSLGLHKTYILILEELKSIQY